MAFGASSQEEKPPIVQPPSHGTPSTAKSYFLSSSLSLTAGQLNLSPGSSNCIPGKCVFTLDIRSGDGDILKNILKKVDFCAREQEKAGMEVETKTLSYREPVLMDDKLQSEIEKSCQKLNLSYRYLDSGAAMRSHRNFICTVMIWEEVISSQVKTL